MPLAGLLGIEAAYLNLPDGAVGTATELDD
jgi:hypothetical protein